MRMGDVTRIGLASVAIAVLFGAAPAEAQIGGMTVPGPVAHAAKIKQAPQSPAPAALPGAVATPAAPANPNAGNLSPDAALFDAIERGDIGAARAALSRGASLSAHNVLGQTPLDVAIDLGRNDITFLLLSLRNTQAAGAPSPAVPLPATPKAAHPAAPPVRRAALPATPKPPVPSAGPKLFAADGGTPDPAAGFLGFGGAAQ